MLMPKEGETIDDDICILNKNKFKRMTPIAAKIKDFTKDS